MRISKLAALLGVAAMIPGIAQAQEWRGRGDGGGVRAERGARPDAPRDRPTFEGRRDVARPDRPGGFQPQAVRVPDRDMMQPRGRSGGTRTWSNDVARPDPGQRFADRDARPATPDARTERPDWNQNRDRGRPEWNQARDRNQDRDRRYDNRGNDDRRGWNGQRDRDRGDRNDWWNRNARDRHDRARSNADWRDQYRDQRAFYDRQRFNHDWRRNDRYDWRRYRNSNRAAYHLPRYYAPYGWDSGYRRFGIGFTLSSSLFARNYWISDPYSYRLPPVDGPYRWVRYYDDALLVDLRTGGVVDVVYDIFW